MTDLVLDDGVPIGDVDLLYATRGDVEHVFGIGNVTLWADLDNSGDGDVADLRVGRALQEATEYIRKRIGVSTELPLVAPYDKELVRMTATLAGLYLYSARGVTDSEDTNIEIKKHRREIAVFINNVRSGALSVGAQLLGTNIPGVVKDNTVCMRCGRTIVGNVCEYCGYPIYAI